MMMNDDDTYINKFLELNYPKVMLLAEWEQ